MSIKEVKPVETGVYERKIAHSMIFSSQFHRMVSDQFKPEYIKCPELRYICRWCVDHYKDFDEAPKKDIDPIFEKKTKKLNPDVKQAIEDILISLFDMYDDTVNADYEAKDALHYFQKRNLEILKNNIDYHLKSDDIQSAQDEVAITRDVVVNLNTTDIIVDGDPEVIAKIAKNEKENKKLFKLDGDIGDYLGWFKKSELICYLAPAKSGKTFLLADHYRQAVMQKKKVVFFSVEMTPGATVRRVTKAFYPCVDTEAGMYKYPEFDCIKNQNGECSDRESEVIVIDDDGEYFEDLYHVPCTKCKDTDPDKYQHTVIHRYIHRKQYTEELPSSILTVRDTGKPSIIGQLRNKYGRMIVHAKHTLTREMILKDLENLKTKEGFVPEIIIIDYADIMITEGNDWNDVDMKWRGLAALTADYLVITATQTNKSGFSSKLLSVDDQGDFYGKVRHVDAMYGINMTKEEKAQGVARINKMQVREGDDYSICYILHDFKAGVMNIDSYNPNKFYSFSTRATPEKEALIKKAYGIK